MDDRLRQQLEGILEKAETADRARTLEFFEKAKSIEPPPEEERHWLVEQFRILAKVIKWSMENKKEANMVLTLNLFTMGRAYERYYTQKRGEAPSKRGAASLTSPLHRGAQAPLLKEIRR